jgi:hypothetical protein
MSDEKAEEPTGTTTRSGSQSPERPTLPAGFAFRERLQTQSDAQRRFRRS